MNVNLTNVAQFEKELHITLSWSEVQDDYSELLERYAKVPLKGFRAGKVPQGLIETTFKNEIKNDLVSMCAKRACRAALREQGLEAASPLELSNVSLEKENHLSFTAQFIEAPTFDLPDYRRLNLTAATDEEKLDEVSLKLLERTTFSIHPRLVEQELAFSEADEQQDKAKAAAEQRVKLMLILKKIAAQDSVEVDDKDVALRIEQIAHENELHPEELRTYLQQNGGMERLSDSLLAEQVLGYIIAEQQA